MHLTNTELATIADLLEDWTHNEAIRLLQDRIYTHLILENHYTMSLEEIDTVYGTAYRIRDGLFEATGTTPLDAVRHLLECKSR